MIDVITDPELSPHQVLVLRVFEKHGPQTLRAVEKRLGKSRGTVCYLVDRLVELGRLEMKCDRRGHLPWLWGIPKGKGGC